MPTLDLHDTFFHMPTLDKFHMVAGTALLGPALAFGSTLAPPALDAPAVVMLNSCSRAGEDAVYMGFGTRVDLAIFVDETGTPKSAQPVGEIADQETLDAAKVLAFTCKFRPALISGKPSKGIARLELSVSTLRQPAPDQGTDPAITDLQACAPTSGDYPDESRRRNETGTTKVRFTVDSKGHLIAFGVAKSSGSLRLDFTALLKLAGCSFKPGVGPDGAPIGGSFAVDYVWKLE